VLAPETYGDRSRPAAVGGEGYAGAFFRASWYVQQCLVNDDRNRKQLVWEAGRVELFARHNLVTAAALGKSPELTSPAACNKSASATPQ